MLTTVEDRFEKLKARLGDVGISLFDYQEEGVKWMLEHELNPEGVYEVCGGLLCDDPGLGKTLQTISLMLANPVSKTLIVCPISLMEQWRDQIRKAWPSVKMRINDSAGLIKDHHELQRDFDVLISGYSRVWKTDKEGNFQKTVLHTIEWGRVVLDECHIIRNRKAKTSLGCQHLRAKYRWGLSGTPLQNKEDDIKTLFHYMHIPAGSIPIHFHKLMDQYIKRRNKSLVADKYNELKINLVNVPFDTEEERKFYINVEEEVRKEFLRIIHEGDVGSSMMELFELLLRLRQATIHPNLVIKGLAKKYEIQKPKLWKGPCTKIHKMMELFAHHEPGDKAIIVCHYREEIDLAQFYLGKAFPKLRMEVFSGGLSLPERNEIVSNCTKGLVDVLFIQILAGGVGLNLQVFNKVYMLTPNWNPGNEIQAIARCHRIGQTRPVEVFKIVINDEELPMIAIDERIIGLQQTKRGLMVDCLGDDTLQFNEEQQNSFQSKASSGVGLTLSFKDMKKLLLAK